MSGHSKWSTIKRAKGAADAKRGQQFSKLSRAITVAAKQGGPDPDSNPRLKMAIEAARAANMPKDNIARAIDKVSGGDADNIDEVTYEGYGPGGSAILIQAMTDNRNRTVAEIRNIFNKAGGSMSESGSVAWLFTPQTIIEVELEAGQAEEASMVAIEAGAIDLDYDSATNALTVIADPATSAAVSQALTPYGNPQSTDQLVASNNLELDPEHESKLVRLLETLDEHDDVQQVSTNAMLQTM
jgi:YebC/PmpR family DNA-binding regulatory protein